MATILALHHKYTKLLSHLRHMLLRVPSEKVSNQPICRTKEQKARLQFLAGPMPKSVMPSGAKIGSF